MSQFQLRIYDNPFLEDGETLKEDFETGPYDTISEVRRMMSHYELLSNIPDHKRTMLSELITALMHARPELGRDSEMRQAKFAVALVRGVFRAQGFHDDKLHNYWAACMKIVEALGNKQWRHATYFDYRLRDALIKEVRETKAAYKLLAPEDEDVDSTLDDSEVLTKGYLVTPS